MPKRILVVEDNADMRELLDMYLRSAGYTVTLAEDGCGGLCAVKAECPDLLITDLRMPNGDGVELIERLRAEPGLIELPILVLTANGDGKSHKAREAGADVIMRKPVDLDSLIDIVKVLLKIR
ncbi:MAG TPA: response regulator [Candidatus Saccharimonadales bacterium]|nr:response regulator [Candidatus Saccharimonadales bacterium]